MAGTGAYQQMSVYGVPVAEPNTNVAVVSDVFCSPYPLELTVKKKSKGLSGSKVEVVDVVNSNVVLYVDGPHNSFSKKRVLRDPSGYPLLTMREKVTSMNHQWTVHRGEGSDPTELMFTVQRSQVLQWRARLDVFLQSNHLGNFSVVGTYLDDSAKVYHADYLIAEVKEKSTFRGYFRGKQDFVVGINAGVDYAFIVSLLVILNETNSFSFYNFVQCCQGYGAFSTPRSPSPLHTEIEAMRWAMQCMADQNRRDVAFFTDSSELLEIISMPREWPAFREEITEIKRLQRMFNTCQHIKIPRQQNLTADDLARSARQFSYSYIYLNSVPPNWAHPV